MTQDYKPQFPADESKFAEIVEALLKSPAATIITPATGILTLDALAAENGANKTQNQWISYWNNIRDGRRFASAADYYQSFKQLKAAEETGSSQQKAEAHALAESLREDLKEFWIVTSTRNIYNPPSLEAEIIQHYGNSNPALTRKVKLEVPEWLGVPITEVLKGPKCLSYLQAIFATTDPAETIISTLEYMGGVARNNIKLWTPPVEEDKQGYLCRKKAKEREAFLGIGGGEFRFDGGDHPGNVIGSSRGVRG